MLNQILLKAKTVILKLWREFWVGVYFDIITEQF